MDKILGLLPFFFFFLPLSAPKDNYKSYIQAGCEANTRGNYTFSELKNYEGTEFRVYRYEDYLVDEIDDNAFKDSSISTLVISDCVLHINDAALDNATNLTTLKYTGSKEDFAKLGLKQEWNDKVVEYAVDEGFINYWNKNIRPNGEFNICSISEETYNTVYKLYRGLFGDDLTYVNDYVDAGGAKIKDSIKTLVDHFDEGSHAQTTEEWNQTGAITLIIFIAILGMTSITVFFLLKTKNIIQ